MKNLIQKLRKEGIILKLNENDLDVYFDGEAIQHELLQEIRDNKQHLITYLSKFSTQKEASSVEPIPAIPLAKNYALSSSQRRLWVLSQLDTDNYAYNMSGVLEFEGHLDIKAFDQAFNRLIARHESLRTIFKEDAAGQVKQWVLPEQEHRFKLKYHDLRTTNDKTPNVESVVVEALQYRFNLAEDALLRACLIQRSTNQYVFVYVMHHIVSDGWSMDIMIRDLLAFYNGSLNQENIELPALRIHYKDYAAWQQNNLQKPADQKLAAAKKYWINQFSNELPILNMPLDYKRPTVQTFNGVKHTCLLNKNTTKQLKTMAQETGSTLFMSLLASVNVLLYKYTGQTDLILGSPIAGRAHVDLSDQIGVYINTLALRTQFTPETNFKELLQAIKENTLNAYEYQSYPFDALLEELNVARDRSRNPLFDVMVVLQNTAQTDISKGFEGLTIKPYSGKIEQVISKFDLTFNFTERDDQIELEIEYNSDLYKKNSIERLANHFCQLVPALLINSELPIADHKYLTQAEEKQLLSDFNDTNATYPKEKTIIELFEDQVERTPNNVAVVFEEQTLTYTELNEKANQLGHYLQQNYAIQPDDLVAIMLDRTAWMIISILAVLKSGGAYVPIDPEYPEERINYMLKDTASKVLIDQKELDQFITTINNYQTTNLAQTAKPNHLAYVIYTSGSTGKPKGTLIENKNVVRLLKTDQPLFDFNAKDVWTMSHSYCFDFSVWEIYGALLFGGKLVVVNAFTIKEPTLFLELLAKESVTILNQTPSAFYNLIKEEYNVDSLSLRYVIFGGEKLESVKLKDWNTEHPQVKLINMYGITETTVHVTFKELQAEDFTRNVSNIGKPIPTLRAYILDNKENLVPIGVIGEICISGEGLARGYLNRPALTAEKFVNNPFETGQRMYKSGDLGRWLPDGNIEYIGRKDDQVKIRGYRIEIGEIEASLNQNEAVTTGVVLVKENKLGHKQLVAYIQSDEQLNTAFLRAHLKGTLPDYMIPSYFVQVDEFPLTSNGKLDKKGLPDPEGLSLSSGMEYVAPSTDLARKLANIWAEVLEVAESKIGIYDDFFGLGGDSIKAIKIVARIKNCGYPTINIAKLFTYPSIEELSKFLMSTNKDPKEEYDKSKEEITTYVNALEQNVLNQRTDKEQIASVQPMTDIQKGMCLYTLLNPESGIYHDQMVLPTTKIIPVVFEKALNLLIDKHEILRCRFNFYNYQEEVSIIYKKQTETVFHEDLSTYSVHEAEKHIKNYLADELKNPFSVHEGQLWRVSLFTISEQQSVFIFQCHHAILDGWSDQLFRIELWQTYKRLIAKETVELKPFNLSWKDISIHALYERGNISVANFWKAYLDDYNRLDMFTSEVANDNYEVAYNSSYLEKIKTAAKSDKVAVKSVFLSSFIYALNVISQEKDITLGLVSHMRPQVEEADQVLGCFLNTIPLRVKMEDNSFKNSIASFVQRINTAVVNLTDKSGLSLRDIGDLLNEKTEQSQNLFSDILFNYVDFYSVENVKEDLSSFPSEHINIEGNISTNYFFELSVNSTLDHLNLVYTASKVLKSTMSLKRFHQAVDSYLNAYLNQKQLGEINYLSQAEEKQLLFDFNDTKADYPKDKTVIELFEEQVARTPDQVAIVFNEVELTYKKLNEQANQLGDYLRTTYLIQPDDLVAILLDRSEWMIISIWAVLKSGGAYLPIDPEYPQDRINFTLKDANPKALIDKQELQKFKAEATNYSTDNPAPIAKEDHLAYAIYTSGSTGKPKGVLVENEGLVNHILNVQKECNLSTESKFLQFLNVAFDASVEEIFPSLCAGASLIIRDHHNANDIIALINTHGITHAAFPTAFFENLIVANDSDQIENPLLVCMVGGDKLRLNFIATNSSKIGRVTKSVFNVYGPTETTVTATRFEVLKKIDTLKVLPIGKPYGNRTMHILDDHGKLLPIGVIGEICIAGAGLARGYLNRPDLTAKKFVSNPFEDGKRMYKTGDLGRWLPDGNIEFIGRKDGQVKIRGYRIELGEIETAILQHTAIREGVVLAKETEDGDKQLVAYLRSEQALNANELRTHLKGSLPDYMIPAFFVQLAEFPLTSSGKVDKRALPDPEGLGLSSGIEYVAPSTTTEKQIVHIWSDVLQLEAEKIGLHDDFFTLGGHSLKATTVINKIAKAFNVKLAIKDIFANTTIEDLSQVVDNATTLSYQEIAVLPIQESYELSSAQRRLWVLSQIEEENYAYNMPGVYELNGKLDVHAFKHAFDQLIARHESLRTVFKQDDDGTIKQWVLAEDAHNFTFNYQDVRSNNNQEETIKRLVKEESQYVFDLEFDALLRATLIQQSTDSYVFVFVMHHIISDGWSMNILVRDLFTYYNGFVNNTTAPLPHLRIQYKDYSGWQQDILAGNDDKTSPSKQYWLDQFSGVRTKIKLPYDFIRPPVKNYTGNEHHQTIISNDLKEFKSILKQENASLFMGLLSIVNVLFSKYGNQETIIGSPIAGRDHHDLNDQIGFYVNTLALKTSIDERESFMDLLIRAKAQTLQAYDHQNYPFDELVKALNVKPDISRNPLFDFHLLLQNFNQDNFEQKIQDVEIQAVNSNEFNISKFDLTFTFMEEGDDLSLTIEYDDKLFLADTIAQIGHDFSSIFQAVSANPDQQIQALTIASADHVLIASTFTSNPLEDAIHLFSTKKSDKLQPVFADYNQVLQLVNNPGSPFYQTNGCNVLLIRWEDCYREVEDQQDLSGCKQKIEDFKDYLTKGLGANNKALKKKTLLLYDTTLLTENESLVAVINEINAILLQEIGALANIEAADISEICKELRVKETYDHHLNEIAHIPFHQDAFNAIGTYISKWDYQCKAEEVKIIVLDCDNTLWKGILGESSYEDIEIDASRVQFHKQLKALKEQGYILTICSKNNEEDVVNFFSYLEDRPELLHFDDFVSPKINWSRKSENIQSIADELNLGLANFLFIDDSDLECYEVRTSLPQVVTIQMPQNPTEINGFITNLWCFNKKQATQLDTQRTQLYQQESHRKKLEAKFENYTSFIESLEVKTEISPVSPDDSSRVAQLTARTNQFNANKKIYSREEIIALTEDHQTQLFSVKVEDVFGSYGTVGVVLVKIVQNTLVVENILLSCRVLGRGVEHNIIQFIGNMALENKMETIRIIYQPTSRNKPVALFLKDIGAIKNENEFLITTANAVNIQITTKKHEQTSSKTNTNKDTSLLRKRYEERLLKMASTELNTLEKIGEAAIRFGNQFKIVTTTKTEYVAPGTETEKQLAQIWSEVLGIEENIIGIKDDFFALGGHSLKATTIISKISNELNIQLSIKDSFTKTTIIELAELIDRKSIVDVNKLSIASDLEEFEI